MMTGELSVGPGVALPGPVGVGHALPPALEVGAGVALVPSLDVDIAAQLAELRAAGPVILPVLLTVASGQNVWVDNGPPEFVPGSAFGDLYLDDLSGDLYRLT